MSSINDKGLRIGELAELTGTTPRAIRHYHQLGLLAEPDRDESGYRRCGPQHLIRLVRIRRLRSVGMPLERIAASVGTESTDIDIASTLRSLADETEQQIEGLTDLRARVLDIAASGSLSDPATTWEAELRRRGVLEPSVELPAAEQAAARRIDSLHPEGIQRMIDQTILPSGGDSAFCCTASRRCPTTHPTRPSTRWPPTTPRQCQHLGAAARERLAPAELEHLVAELAAIRELVATRVTEPDRDQPLGQVDELRSEALEADEPRPARLARVYRWFLENVPGLAESVSSLLLGPLVGKLVGGGAGAVAAALGGRERRGESRGEAPGEALP